jgi:hypothetical protein
MNPVRLTLIVTGHGEKEAVPILIRRIATEINPSLVVDIPEILRESESSLRQAGGLERHVERAAQRLDGPGGVLVLLDCDWENGCPARDGPALLARAQQTRPDKLIAVVLAKQEYEAWFLAAAESLAGKRGLPVDLTAPDDPETIRGAKEWLRSRMPANRAYSETIDQPKLTAALDLEMARRADSFDKFYRDLSSMLYTLALECGHPNA